MDRLEKFLLEKRRMTESKVPDVKCEMFGQETSKALLQRKLDDYNRVEA